MMESGGLSMARSHTNATSRESRMQRVALYDVIDSAGSTKGGYPLWLAIAQKAPARAIRMEKQIDFSRDALLRGRVYYVKIATAREAKLYPFTVLSFFICTSIFDKSSISERSLLSLKFLKIL